MRNAKTPDKVADLLCNAYTYIEFNKSFRNYYDNSKPLEFESKEEALIYWNTVIVRDYNLTSEYMKPSAIKQAQKLVIGEF